MQCIVVAAGVGVRLGAPVPKALVDVGGVPLLVRTLLRLRNVPELNLPPIVTIPEPHRPAFEEALKCAGIEARLIAGGVERQDSVLLALQATPPGNEITLIHDAARPFVPVASVKATIAAACEVGASTVAIPVTDTILEADAEGFLQGTPDRARLWACQTPQTFRHSLVIDAHQRAVAEGFRSTDDASLVRRYGGTVRLVMGHPYNIKITRPEDIPMAQRILEEPEWDTE